MNNDTSGFTIPRYEVSRFDFLALRNWCALLPELMVGWVGHCPGNVIMKFFLLEIESICILLFQKSTSTSDLFLWKIWGFPIS